jgi:glycosyltransferase involved in cell wall biosynthesis
MKKVCIDLSPNEMHDRHGGFGRYAYYLLESLLALPEIERQDIELWALVRSDRPPVPAHQALDRSVLNSEPISEGRHNWQRRIMLGPLLKSAGIDVFHATVINALPVTVGCKVVATSHDLVPLVLPQRATGWQAKLDQRLRRRWRQVRHRRPDHIIAISETTKRDLVKVLEVPSDSISVVHHGIDRDRFGVEAAEGEREFLQQKYDLPNRYFISVGSDQYRKNQTRLYEAWVQASPFIDEGLVLVGRSLYGEVFQSIVAEAKRAGKLDRLRWLDSVDDAAELAALYRQSTASVAPSLYEGFGFTLLESMACGTPVIASRQSAHQEVAGDAAEFFEPKSAAGLGAVLRRLGQDRKIRTDLREKGLNRVDSFTWPRAARESLAVYRQIFQ